MAFDEGLAQRLREIFEPEAEVDEKKMFGGLVFMLSGHMCCGVDKDHLMARVGPAQYDQALDHPHACVMDFTGKPLTGFIYVDAEGLESDKELTAWVYQCIDFVRTLPPK